MSIPLFCNTIFNIRMYVDGVMTEFDNKNHFSIETRLIR